MAGRFWWSFYESDAYFENFVIRALAYVSRSTPDEVRKLPTPERETALLQILDREPHLLVLDGLERILVAYARMDTAYLADDDYDRATANWVAQHVAQLQGVPHLAGDIAQSFTGEQRPRKTADPRAGQMNKEFVYPKPNSPNAPFGFPTPPKPKLLSTALGNWQASIETKAISYAQPAAKDKPPSALVQLLPPLPTLRLWRTKPTTASTTPSPAPVPSTSWRKNCPLSSP